MHARALKSLRLVACTLAAANGFSAANAQSDSIRTKEITKLSPKASVVLDKNCPTIVQPYTLTDNAATLALFSAKEAVSDIGGRLLESAGSLLKGGGRPSIAPASSKLTASTKLAAKQLNWLPMATEVAYGERLHQDEPALLERDSKLGLKHYPVADKILAQILDSVGEPQEYQFKLYILKNASRNAAARPGGFLYLDQGLVDDPAQLPKAYFALAHEVAHVLQRHETKELQSTIVDSVSSKDDLMRIMTTSQGNPTAALAYIKIEKNRLTQHHVDQELQADSCAVRLLSRALPDQKTLVASINAFINDLPKADSHVTAVSAPQSDEGKLARSVHDIVDTPAKRHPNNEERLQNLRSIYSELSLGALPKRP